MKTNRRKPSGRCRGVALITTLLLLSLFSVMTLAMVIATSSDTLINGYYRNFRGSFYGADSGINAVRQYMINQFDATTPTSANYAGLATTVFSGLTNSSTGFGAFKSITGSQADSWSGKFKVDAANSYLTAGGCAPTYTGGPTGKTCAQVASDGTLTVTAYTYNYPYKLTVIGQSNANEANTIVEEGAVVMTVNITSNSSVKTNFASYGTLFDQYAICSSPFVKGTMTGKFFSNDSWNFGDDTLVTGSYIFTDPVGAANANVGYMYRDPSTNNTVCHQSAASSDTYTYNTSSGGRHPVITPHTITIAPTFQGGLLTGQTPIPLPASTINQEKAVLDGLGDVCVSDDGCDDTRSAAQIQDEKHDYHLRTATGLQYPASGTTEPTSGVYVPYVIAGDLVSGSDPVTGTACGAPPCVTGGGIYVKGNADQIVMTASTSGSGASTHKLQVFDIKQGSLTTTVTVDLTGGTTKIDDHVHTAVTLTGTPLNKNSSTEAALIYVDGNISGTSSGTTTGLKGPSSGAAIQDGSAVTVASTGTIAITGSIKYTTEPVTLTQVGSTPAGTLVPGATNVLGIYTSGGDIQVRPPSNVTSMEIDASLAMISDGGSGGLVAQWNNVGTLTIVGGRIANQAKSGNSLTTRNIWFDRRFSSGDFAPPFFPSTHVTTTGPGTADPPIVTVSRVSWVNTTAQ